MDWRFSLAGLLVGFLIGFTGVGGGALLAPILLIIFRVPPVWAVSTDIVYSAITKGVGSIIHIRQKFVHFKISLWLACGSIPATLCSVLLVHFIRQHSDALINTIIIRTIGAVLIVVAMLLLLRPTLMRLIERKQITMPKQQANDAQEDDSKAIQPAHQIRRWQPPIIILVGAVVGFLVGLTSVGSGSLIIISLFLLFPKLSPKELVGTDIFQAFMMLLAGSIGYLFSGTVNWTITGLLLVGSLPGVLIGSRLSKYIPNSYMQPILAVVLAISGWKLL